MYHFFRQNPLFKPVLFFLLGIVFFYQLNLVSLLSFASLLLLAHFLFRKYLSDRIHLVWPILLFLIGYFSASFHKLPKPLEDSIAEVYQIKIIKQKPSKYVKVWAECASLHRTEKVKALFILNSSLPLNADSLYLINCNLKYLRGAQNPNGFDYGAYMSLQNIHLSAFVNEEDILPYKKLERFDLRLSAQHIQTYFSNQLDQFIADTQMASIAKALIIGNASELDEETRENYSSTGTMHVLAVSGMHVGILYLLIQFALRIVPSRWLRLSLALILLWTYAFITGLSPSVLRAVTMFSMMGIGKEIGRQYSVYNALAFAALVLLLFDPVSLYHAGFQLSFLSVLGIVFLSPKIQNSKLFSKIKVKPIKTLLSVSLAAQISTGMLSLYYFHQFPSWFLISNLLVVPIAAPIMLSGIGILIFSKIPVLAQVFAWLCQLLLQISFSINSFIANWPYAQLGPFYPSLGFSLFFYALLFLIMVYFLEKNKIYLWSILIGLVMFQSVHLYGAYKQNIETELIVFSVKNKSCVLLREGNKTMLYSDTLSQIEFERLLHPYLKLGDFDLLADSNSMSLASFQMKWKSEAIIFLNAKNLSSFKGELTKNSLLIVSKGAKLVRKEVLGTGLFRKIVLDSSCDYFTRKYWTSLAEKYSISIHDVKLQGAFIYKIHGRTS